MTKLSPEKPELFKGRHFNHLLIIQAVRTKASCPLMDRIELLSPNGSNFDIDTPARPGS